MLNPAASETGLRTFEDVLFQVLPSLYRNKQARRVPSLDPLNSEGSSSQCSLRLESDGMR